MLTLFFSLISLPYAPNALEPVISQETIEYHYGKHLQTYVDNLNKLVAGTEYESMPLEQIVAQSQGAIFNNAGQILNHNLYFMQFSPVAANNHLPQGAILEASSRKARRCSVRVGYGSLLTRTANSSSRRKPMPIIPSQRVSSRS